MLIFADVKTVMPNSETSLAAAISAHGSKVATQLMQVMDKSLSACLRTVIVEEEGAMPRSILRKAVSKGRPIHTTVWRDINKFNGYAQ